LDDDEVSNLANNEVRNIDIPNRGVNIINESGLYNLIFRSRKPEARAFRKWVTAEVLPAIRKTGSYAVPSAKAFVPFRPKDADEMRELRLLAENGLLSRKDIRFLYLGGVNPLNKERPLDRKQRETSLEECIARRLQFTGNIKDSVGIRALYEWYCARESQPVGRTMFTRYIKANYEIAESVKFVAGHTVRVFLGCKLLREPVEQPDSGQVAAKDVGEGFHR
jgi:hypothetical protein